MKQLMRHRTYVLVAVLCMASALAFSWLGGADERPGIGDLPLVLLTVSTACIGLPCIILLQDRGIAGSRRPRKTARCIAGLVGLGATLAIAPVAIDITFGFPDDLNVPLPAAIPFYLAAALIAETVFHLVPLALLAVLMPPQTPVIWLVLPVVLIEPAFQVWAGAGAPVPALFTFASVGLVSLCQLWLFLRYGFGAMIALRLIYYLFWHIVWGGLRLPLLF